MRDALVGLHSTIRSPVSLELHAHWRDGCFCELCKNSWTSWDAVRGVGARNRVCPDPFPHGNGHFLVEILGYAQTGTVNILGILNTISKWAAAVQPLATCSVATCLKKAAHTRLPNVGFRSWSWFLAVSLQVTSHKPSSRLPVLSARPAVTLVTLKRAATSFAAWWTEARWVWTVCPRLLPESIAAAIWTLLRLSPAR